MIDKLRNKLWMLKTFCNVEDFLEIQPDFSFNKLEKVSKNSLSQLSNHGILSYDVWDEKLFIIKLKNEYFEKLVLKFETFWIYCSSP